MLQFLQKKINDAKLFNYRNSNSFYKNNNLRHCMHIPMFEQWNRKNNSEVIVEYMQVSEKTYK